MDNQDELVEFSSFRCSECPSNKRKKNPITNTIHLFKLIFNRKITNLKVERFYFHHRAIPSAYLDFNWILYTERVSFPFELCVYVSRFSNFIRLIFCLFCFAKENPTLNIEFGLISVRQLWK